MDAQELQSPKNVLTIWVKNLGSAVKTLSNTISSMIVKKPKAAIKLDTAPLDKTYPEETVLPEEGLYRSVYELGEHYGDQKRRSTDFIWSKNTYRLDRVLQETGNCVLCYLQDLFNKAFKHEELMHLSQNTQVPPGWMSEWK